jgi:hypothetical protein
MPGKLGAAAAAVVGLKDALAIHRGAYRRARSRSGHVLLEK